MSGLFNFKILIFAIIVIFLFGGIFYLDKNKEKKETPNLTANLSQNFENKESEEEIGKTEKNSEKEEKQPENTENELSENKELLNNAIEEKNELDEKTPELTEEKDIEGKKPEKTEDSKKEEIKEEEEKENEENIKNENPEENNFSEVAEENPQTEEPEEDFSPPQTAEETLLPPPEILITEVQINGDSANFDFIELFNPEAKNADISGFQLKKKSSTGKEYSVRVFTENSHIPAKGYFLWANSDYVSSGKILADISSSQTLAKNNSVALLDKDKNIIDAVSWGKGNNSFFETSPFPDNPEEGQTLGRKFSSDASEYIDTDNNLNDFEIRFSTPKNRNLTFIAEKEATTTEPADIPEETEEETEETEEEETEQEQEQEKEEEERDGEEVYFDVVINEIAWMGTKAGLQDEWVELYNNSDSAVDITGWRLVSPDGSPDILFSTSSIKAGNFFLMERTDDDAVSDILADWTGSFGRGGLKNTGEKLELKDADDNLIDIVDCSAGWFSGIASPDYISMERIDPNLPGSDPNNWADNKCGTGKDAEGNLISGTPKLGNSVLAK